MKRNLILLLGIIAVFGFNSCKKEYSAETRDTPANGSLQKDITSECLPKTLNGLYIAGETLDNSNYIDVEINVTNPGSFTIVTDTLNGYAFKATGNFADAGLKTVRLEGSGTPLTAGNNLFVVSFDTSFCLIQVVVLPAGSGGPANFTLLGSGATCLNYAVAGDYVKDVALAAGNTVTVNVNVTTIGTYNITTAPVNGMTFSGSGTLASTGPQTIVLTGSGTPVAEETSVVSLTAGSSTCTFDVDVTAVAVAADYYPRTTNSNWTYEIDGDVNDTLFRVVTPLTHSALGNTWNIFGESLDVSQGIDSGGYFRKAANDYYQFIDFNGLLGLTNENWGEFLFLKDNQPVGTSWTSGDITGTESGVSITVRLKMTVVQKDASITVKGTTYPNTIVIEERVEQLVGGNWNDISSVTGYFKSYYSRNIGLIKKELIGTNNQTESVLELRRYQVF